MQGVRNLGLFAKDIGIDLGTANILLGTKNGEIVIKEPSVVAMDNASKKIIAIGTDAKEMLGRTPENLLAIRPLKDGVIADFTATKKMLKYFVEKACQKYVFSKPRVVVGVPLGVTEVEESAVQEAVIEAGAREVFLIEEPMAAAIGAGINISEASGSMIVDMGGGTSEIAVISYGGIVAGKSIRIAR
jgi:rod shape-determining protein MreB